MTDYHLRPGLICTSSERVVCVYVWACRVICAYIILDVNHSVIRKVNNMSFFMHSFSISPLVETITTFRNTKWWFTYLSIKEYTHLTLALEDYLRQPEKKFNDNLIYRIEYIILNIDLNTDPAISKYILAGIRKIVFWKTFFLLRLSHFYKCQVKVSLINQSNAHEALLCRNTVSQKFFVLLFGDDNTVLTFKFHGRFGR